MKAASLFLALEVMISYTAAHAVTLEMVTVGNPGNAPDTEVMITDLTTGFGSVGYVYQIGKYEVTAGQYTEFLNAVAKADPHRLYHDLMGDLVGIQRSDSSPNYSYSVGSNCGDDCASLPVSLVSFWDAARFANWLHNGQPSGAQGPGTTEDGAYVNVGNKATFARQPGAKYFIPSEDEWYKAAYHDQSAGLAASYFDYPTGTNSQPGNDLTETTKPGNNVNTPFTGEGHPFDRTMVGEFELSDNPYGTFDQGGNVWEWNEGLYFSARALRGGSFLTNGIRAFYRTGNDPIFEDLDVGFRIATIIPEPSALLLGALACVGLLVQRRCVTRFAFSRRTAESRDLRDFVPLNFDASHRRAGALHALDRGDKGLVQIGGLTVELEPRDAVARQNASVGTSRFVQLVGVFVRHFGFG